MRSRFVRPVRRRELPTMRVGVIDVGANTMRLLVAAYAGTGLTTVHRERVQLGLGEYVEQGGAIPRDRLAAAGRAARDQAASARRLGCSRIEIVVTSPGRQAENADELIASLERVRGASARVLTAEEEASYAYRAVARIGRRLVAEHRRLRRRRRLDADRRRVVRGGAVLGALARRRLASPHAPRVRRRSPDERRRSSWRTSTRSTPLFAGLTPPLPARRLRDGRQRPALGKLVGPRLGARRAHRRAAHRCPSVRRAGSRRRSTSRRRGPARCPAGALLLASAQQLLGVPLEVARAGLREGVALSLLADAAVAA